MVTIIFNIVQMNVKLAICAKFVLNIYVKNLQRYIKEAVEILGHSLYSWCIELLDENTYFDTAACILMRHWIGDVSKNFIQYYKY